MRMAPTPGVSSAEKTLTTEDCYPVWYDKYYAFYCYYCGKTI